MKIQFGKHDNYVISVLRIMILVAALPVAFGVQILSKSKLEKCEKSSDSDTNLNCTKKIVLNMAVPSGSVRIKPLSLLSLDKHFSNFT